MSNKVSPKSVLFKRISVTLSSILCIVILMLNLAVFIINYIIVNKGSGKTGQFAPTQWMLLSVFQCFVALAYGFKMLFNNKINVLSRLFVASSTLSCDMLLGVFLAQQIDSLKNTTINLQKVSLYMSIIIIFLSLFLGFYNMFLMTDYCSCFCFCLREQRKAGDANSRLINDGLDTSSSNSDSTNSLTSSD
jgi:hypothetical protein